MIPAQMAERLQVRRLMILAYQRTGQLRGVDDTLRPPRLRRLRRTPDLPSQVLWLVRKRA